MSEIEDQFEAAVTVIQGLPKGGPYQPSHAVMLKFYGYYKQATKGKCNQPKPSFWDVVGKAKWEAWNKCGNMTQQQAMKSYIDELKQVWKELKEKVDPDEVKKIIETMSFTSEVSAFMDTLGPFYESVEKEEEENQNNHNRNESKASNLPIEYADKQDNLLENPEVSVQSNRLRDDNLKSSEQNNESEHEILDNHWLEEKVKDDNGQEDLFLTEGMAFTKSIDAVREELTEIKDQCFTNYIPTDQNILSDPSQTMSNETTFVPTCFESNEESEFRLSNHHLQQNVYSENSLLCKKISSSISDGDDTSDIFEDPMSFPEFDSHLDLNKNTGQFEEHYREDIEFNALKNGLVSTTEKSLKDAVISLRKDMTDVTSRIKDLEERLNQLTSVQNKEKNNGESFIHDEEKRELQNKRVHQNPAKSTTCDINLPFSELSNRTVFMLLAWPFVANAIIAGIKTTSKHFTKR